MMQHVIAVITGALGTFGFALIAHIHLKHMLAASIGGLMSWAIYLLVEIPTGSVFLGILVASILVYAWSELMARVEKAPVTIFLVPGILPLLPGSFLYYTMLALLNDDSAGFRYYGYTTIAVTLGIACGVVAASVVITYLLKAVNHIKSKKHAV